MKNKTKRGIAIWLMAILTAAKVLTLGGCSDEPKPVEKPDVAKEQNPILLTGLCGGDRSATVRGHLTDAEWADVADKVEAALNDAFDAAGNIGKGRFRAVFGDDVIIIVEKTTKYAKYKVADGAFRTLYLNIAALDGIQADLVAAITAMHTATPDMVQVKKQNRVRYAGGMSPYELAKLQRHGYVRS